MEKLTKAEALFYANSMASIYIMQGYHTELYCHSKSCADSIEVVIYTDNETTQCVIAESLGRRNIPNAKIEASTINDDIATTIYVLLSIPFNKEK